MSTLDSLVRLILASNNAKGLPDGSIDLYLFDEAGLAMSKEGAIAFKANALQTKNSRSTISFSLSVEGVIYMCRLQRP